MCARVSFYTMLDAAHTISGEAAAAGEGEGVGDTESLGGRAERGRGVGRKGRGRGGKGCEEVLRERKGRGSEAEAKREVLRVLEQNVDGPSRRELVASHGGRRAPETAYDRLWQTPAVGCDRLAMGCDTPSSGL